MTHTDVDGPVSGPQASMESLQPQCAAAAAMMHGLARPPMSSYQGGCPTIAEHQEFQPPMQPPMQLPMRSSMPDVILLQDSSQPMGT